ncbi:MAG: hypothetical protein M0Z54_02485 [Thermaerobacter sp.]|nr:hypothetical protein [Thermaerobacter sp.]
MTLITTTGQHSTVLTGGCGLTVNGVSLWDATGAVTNQTDGLFPKEAHGPPSTEGAP